MKKYVIKASGEKELFDIKKFRRSLLRAGASDNIINQLAQEVEKKSDLKTTKEIYRYALGALKEDAPTVAGRYNLKQALFELGPAGYPFEKFVAHIFAAQGFSTDVGTTLPGKCVEHEIDILVQKKDEHSMVECKFHNTHGIKTNVKVSLYIQARFDDLKAYWTSHESTLKLHYAWVVTNTKFTSQAIAYGKCMKLKLLSWNYPHVESLPYLIDTLGIHPITALTCISTKEKKLFIQKGFVLCKDVRSYEHLFSQLRLSNRKIEKIIEESEGICSF